MAKVYTRSGDKGTCKVFGGDRLDKDHPRVECLGAFDEANSSIGVLRVKLGLEHEWQDALLRIQTDMMNMMSHIATPSEHTERNKKPLPDDGAQMCETWMDDMESKMTEGSDFFLLPGGNEVSAQCHVIRTQVRKAERRLATLAKQDTVNEIIQKYINRMSDLFFLMARFEMDQKGIAEDKWKAFRKAK